MAETVQIHRAHDWKPATRHGKFVQRCRVCGAVKPHAKQVEPIE